MQWENYGGKHYESVFTRFYQGYILPVKFKVDKRRAHLATMICSGQISREDALHELNAPPYPIELQSRDKVYVAKKLGFSSEEFEALLRRPAQSHSVFETDDDLWSIYFRIIRFFKDISAMLRFKKLKLTEHIA
jgi:hypothetical protein